MKSKKGLTEADWAMSMGIFILYLVWFFVVLKPTFSPETKMSLPFDELKESFYNEASWAINKTPIIIRSNITGDNEPIIVDFPYEGIEEQYYIAGKYIKLDEGKLFFLANLYRRGNDNTLLYHLLHSASNYTQPSMYSDLTSSEETASTEDLTVTYDDGLIQQVFFKNSIRVMHYSIRIGGNAMDTSESSHSYNKLFSKHKIITPQVNHTSYIILNNSRIYNFFNSEADKRVTVGTRIDTYPYFYINPETGGPINYNESDCDTYTTNYLDVYDDVYGLSFIFDDDVSLEICHNRNLSVTADFDVSGEFEYQLIFHDRQKSTTKMTQPYKLIFGAEEVFEGLSDEKLFYLEDENYSTVRSDWGYGYDFNVTVLNSSGYATFSFGKIPTKYVTTAGKTYNYHKLDKYADMERVSVVLLSW